MLNKLQRVWFLILYGFLLEDTRLFEAVVGSVVSTAGDWSKEGSVLDQNSRDSFISLGAESVPLSPLKLDEPQSEDGEEYQFQLS